MSESIQDSEWYKSRPESVQRRIDTYPPNHLYRLKETGQMVVLYSYSESDGSSCDTCTVAVLRKYNPSCSLERRVFGIRFEDLEDLGPK